MANAKETDDGVEVSEVVDQIMQVVDRMPPATRVELADVFMGTYCLDCGEPFDEHGECQNEDCPSLNEPEDEDEDEDDDEDEDEESDEEDDEDEEESNEFDEAEEADDGTFAGSGTLVAPKPTPAPKKTTSKKDKH